MLGIVRLHNLTLAGSLTPRTGQPLGARLLLRGPQDRSCVREGHQAVYRGRLADIPAAAALLISLGAGA